MTRIGAIWSIISVLAAGLFGQTAAPAGNVADVGNFSHIVTNLDKSVEFYHDLIGLEPDGAVRPFSDNAAIRSLGNTPGAQSRYIPMKIPGSTLGIEIIEYKDIDRQPAHPRFQDPGAANLILTLRDLDSVLTRLKKAGAHMVTPGGKPAIIEGKGTKSQVVFVQDPDGFVLELSQRDPTPATTAPASSNVIGGNFEVAVNDLDATMRFYHDALGFQMQPASAFDGDKVRTETAGTPGAQYRQSRAQIPGTNVSMAFIEFKNVDRKPLHTRVQDPGTAILQLRVRDVDAIAKTLKAAGAEVISEGGHPVSMGATKLVLMRDLNNLFLELLPAPR
jgi:predicted enzyme related to lactoylglutathione lyase